MAERKILFSLDLERFRQIWDTDDWFNLQREFKNNNVPLSNSLLKWLDENIPYFADFENTKTYDIHEKVGEDPENPIAEVWERGNEEEQPVTSKNSEYILSRLLSAQGTNRGFIDFSKRINLDELELEQLKRSDLLGAGFSFEHAHQDLLIVHGMLREIMASPREWLLNFSLRIIRDVVCQRLRQFYEMAQKIVEFEIVSENPKQTHDKLIGEITQFCEQVKEALRPIIAFLSSRKVNQLAAEVNSTVTAAVDKLEAGINRAKENNNSVEKKQAENQEEFLDLKSKMQDQLAKESVSQYKALFENQAEHYRKGGRNWLIMAGGATAVFFLAFYCLSEFLESGGSGLTGALQNLFTKGFLLSPIYVWLNRSIKNYTAQKHLEVINTHRQKALDTFDAFVAAAEGNRETRDAVLLAATDAIFDANQTGYLSTKGSGSDSKSPIQQVIREFIPNKPSPK